MQNGFIESLNVSMRRGLLNAFVFSSLAEVRNKVAEWVLDYNHYRPHKALGYTSPVVFREQKKTGGELNFLNFKRPENTGSLQRSLIRE